MNRQPISAPDFRVWKIMGPIVNSLFFMGLGIWWYAVESNGHFSYHEVIIIVALSIVLIQVWRVATILKYVEIEGDQLVITGLTTTIKVPLKEIVEVKDNSSYKRRPSVIVLRSLSEFGSHIRFFPKKPCSDTLSVLQKQIEDERGNSVAQLPPQK